MSTVEVHEDDLRRVWNAARDGRRKVRLLRKMLWRVYDLSVRKPIGPAERIDIFNALRATDGRRKGRK